MATSLRFVKLALTRLGPAHLVERARAIVLALTGNADFPAPRPALVQITTATDAVEAADAAVLNNGGRYDYLTRDERVQELRDLLTLLGAYVQVASMGDPEKILSAGFRLRKPREPVGPLPAPEHVQAVADLRVGVVGLRWGRVRGRTFYEVQITSSDPLVEEDWRPLLNLSGNRITEQGLISDRAYSFRVRAVGAAGPGPWSNPAHEKPR